ncbi:ribulose-phosphate 3-epimerase [bacterium]|nr:ribulose-phosphate 3-epimerase [bacterium]
MRQIKISASIMCADLLNLADQVRALEEGGVDYLHFDIMDGHFVPNFTFGPDILKAIDKISRLTKDVHLMIEKPELYIQMFVEAGADILTVPVETCTHLHRTLNQIREKGAKAAVALNPATPLENIEYVLDDLDMVLIMTVNPGFAGQQFIPAMVKKVEKLSKKIEERGLNIDIEVDGNINERTIKLLKTVGANVFVGGTSSIFQPDADIVAAAKLMRKQCNA